MVKDTPKDISKDLPKAICFQPFFHKMVQNYHVCFAGANPRADGLQDSESATRALAENPRSGSLTVPIGIGLGPMVIPTPAPSLVMYMGKFWSPGRELKISFFRDRTGRRIRSSNTPPRGVNMQIFR